jgi:hypothetical protein
MRTNTSSSGVSGPRCGQCLGLTTRDSVRQETPGAPMPGLGVKATEKLKAGPPKAAPLNLIRRNK